MSEKIILDACCGGKMFWFNQHEPHTLYIDNREMDEKIIWKSKDDKHIRTFSVHPDIVADFRNLPFDDESFYHIVFDPPHLRTLTDTSWMANKYGHLGNDWQEVIYKGFQECWRVLKTNGTLIFKWNETEIPVSDIIKLIGVQPLYGHKSGKNSRTHWLSFVKFAEQRERSFMDDWKNEVDDRLDRLSRLKAKKDGATDATDRW